MQAQQNRTQIEFVKGKTPPANPTLDHKRKFEYAQSVYVISFFFFFLKKKNILDLFN